MICVHDLVTNLSQTLSPTFPVHCNGLNSIRATQTGLSQTCHWLCRKHLDMSRWFVFVTFMICVHDFPHGEVSVRVGVMEFGLYWAVLGMDPCFFFAADREESFLTALRELSGFHLVQSDERLLVLEMRPPHQATQSIVQSSQDVSMEAHPSAASASVAPSELTKPLRVTITFADHGEKPRPVASIEVDFSRVLLCTYFWQLWTFHPLDVRPVICFATGTLCLKDMLPLAWTFRPWTTAETDRLRRQWRQDDVVISAVFCCLSFVRLRRCLQFLVVQTAMGWNVWTRFFITLESGSCVGCPQELWNRPDLFSGCRIAQKALKPRFQFCVVT